MGGGADWNDGDRINLSQIDADTTVQGDQGFIYIAAANFSGTSGELRVTTNGINTIVRADLDGDGSADFAVKLSGVHCMDREAFVL